MIEVSLKKSISFQLEEVHEEDVPPKRIEAKPTPERIASKDHDMLEPHDPPTMDISRNILQDIHFRIPSYRD